MLLPSAVDYAARGLGARTGLPHTSARSPGIVTITSAFASRAQRPPPGCGKRVLAQAVFTACMGGIPRGRLFRDIDARQQSSVCVTAVNMGNHTATYAISLWQFSLQSTRHLAYKVVSRTDRHTECADCVYAYWRRWHLHVPGAVC
jgi:hypothetical protein